MVSIQSLSLQSLQHADEAAEHVIRHLRSHGVIAYPTETVYGLGSAIDTVSLNNLEKSKQRSPDKRYLLVISNTEMLKDLHVKIPMECEILVKAFWPGAITIVFPAAPEATQKLDPRLISESGGIAVRQTAHKPLRKLIDRIGSPITSTSLNSPISSEGQEFEGVVHFLSQAPNTESVMTLNGGTLTPSQPSTIIDCSGKTPFVVREGAVSLEQIRRFIPLS